MKAIKYFDGKKTIDIEVTEETAACYKQLIRREWRSEKLAKRHRSAVSLWQMEGKNGCRPAGLIAKDPLEEIIEQENRAELRKKLRAALCSLTPEQSELVKMLLKGMGIRKIARTLGKHHATVLELREAVRKKFRKFL